MNGDMKQLLEKALEFSREHWVLLLGIGLVLAILLISIAVVHSVKKSERESVETEPAMDEGQAKEVIVAEGTASDEVEVELIEDAEGMNVDPLSELKLQEDRVSEEDKDIYLDHSEKTNAKKTIQEEVLSSSLSQTDEMMRKIIEMGNLHMNQLESIEIKIENAKVTLHYAAEKKDKLPVCMQDAEADPKTDKQEEIESLIETVSDSEGVVEAKDLSINTEIPTERIKKFGAGNKNISRSGRAYTEEELFRQIKD